MSEVIAISVERCRPGRGTFLELDSHELAIFLSADGKEVVVTDNACPHSSGNLSGGEIRNGYVVCPLHQWEFDQVTGICPLSEKARVRVYDAEIVDGEVRINL